MYLQMKTRLSKTNYFYEIYFRVATYNLVAPIKNHLVKKGHLNAHNNNKDLGAQ